MTTSGRKGFSLIESAIVLAIVGLILGGIWAAASTIAEKRRINDAVTGMLTILENARQLYQGQSYNLAVFDSESITEIIFEAGLAPAHWAPADASSAYIPNFALPGVQMGVFNATDPEGDNIQFRFIGLTTSLCYKFVREVAARTGQEKGRLLVISTDSGSTLHSAPFDPAAIDCSPAPSSWVLISFLRN